MKKVSRVITLLFIVSLILTNVGAAAILSTPTTINSDLRGLWVATVLNIDYPSKPTTDSQILKSEAIKILDDAKDMRLNAVFLQVRPSSDALYKSEYYPWSKYLTAKQGLMPDNDFDPLEFWVTEAHVRGIELHAWINPYRVTKKTSTDIAYDLTPLDSLNPAIVHPDWIVGYPDGNFYFDPAIPGVRKMISDSVIEIIQNYDVDGIHMDDYFYPGKNFNDKAFFEKYGKGFSNISDWRRDNVNKLITDLSKMIKSTSTKVRFGVSPFGIWANKSSNILGSDTKGLQSYSDHFADTRKWVKEGIIDYIAPQLYWNIGYSIADYSKLVSWWADIVKGTDVDLYIGQATYRSGSSDVSSPWYGVAEIEKQLSLNAKTLEIQGNIFYNYKSLANNPALSAVIKASNEKRDGMAASIPVKISNPSANIKTNFSQYYLNGSSDPNKPLFLNGKPVGNRSSQGFFGILLPLNNGANIFTFAQDASYATQVIFKEVKSQELQKMSRAEIPLASVFPKSQEYRTSGEKITLSCQAPIGSKVTVKIGGKSYNMKPSTTKSNGEGLYPATFTYVYTVPTYSGTPRNIDLGEPVYTMNYKGVVKTRKAPAKLGAIMKGAPFYAEVTKEVIFTYPTASSSDGGAFELYKGMIDNVTGMTNNFVRLSSGQWVEKSSVRTFISKTKISTKIKNSIYKTGNNWDVIQFDTSFPAATTASFDGTSLKLNIYTATFAALPALPKDSLFSSAVVSTNNGKAEYIFKLKDNQIIEGYYIEKAAKGIILYVKRPLKIHAGNIPLYGITIMLDPGHGGSSTGAIGPLGINYAEKTINLKTALKMKTELESLGAKVLMTRTTDKEVSLEARLNASRKEKPDMFISIHANSMEDNVDISKVHGFSVFYRERLALPLSEAIYKNTIETFRRNSKGVHNKNFYVIRGTWTPSILLESGFVPNPNEFEWLIDENEQTRLAKSFTDSIVEYFTKQK